MTFLLFVDTVRWHFASMQQGLRSCIISRSKATTATGSDSSRWVCVDRGLFEMPRGLRCDLAAERQVPSYVIFSDMTLRELARVRPSTPERMRMLYGIGDNRLRDFGARVLTLIADYCRQHGLAQDVKA
jgi:superfamily II DNA helicase RecQ